MASEHQQGRRFGTFMRVVSISVTCPEVADFGLVRCSIAPRRRKVPRVAGVDPDEPAGVLAIN